MNPETPAATPVAQPTPKAAPKASPKAAATPVAQPTPKAAPKATPKAKAKARADSEGFTGTTTLNNNTNRGFWEQQSSPNEMRNQLVLRGIDRKILAFMKKDALIYFLIQTIKDNKK